jgi:hypothetical protein
MGWFRCHACMYGYTLVDMAMSTIKTRLSLPLVLLLVTWFNNLGTAQPPAMVCSFYPLEWSDMQTCRAHSAAFMGTTKLDLHYIDKYYGAGCNCWVVPLADRSLNVRVPPSECVGDHDNFMYDIYKNTDVYRVSNSTCYTCKQTFSQWLTFPLLGLSSVRVGVVLVCVLLQLAAGEFGWHSFLVTAHVYVVVIKLNNGTHRYTIVSTPHTPVPINCHTRFLNMLHFCFKYCIVSVAIILDIALVVTLLYVFMFEWIDPVHGLCGDKLLRYGTTYFYKCILSLMCFYVLLLACLLFLRRRGVLDTPQTTPSFSFFSSKSGFKLDMIIL